MDDVGEYIVRQYITITLCFALRMMHTGSNYVINY